MSLPNWIWGLIFATSSKVKKNLASKKNLNTSIFKYYVLGMLYTFVILEKNHYWDSKRTCTGHLYKTINVHSKSLLCKVEYCHCQLLVTSPPAL